MFKENRKNIRRPLRYTAWVGTGESEPLRGCTVSDISETGAKLDVENTEDLPDTFHLLLSGRGGIYRQCRVVWRSQNQIGVHFVRAGPRAKSAKVAAPA